MGMVLAVIHGIDTSAIHGAAAFMLAPAKTFTTRTIPVSRRQLRPSVLNMANSEENSDKSSSPETPSSSLQTSTVEVKCPNCDQCDGSGRYALLLTFLSLNCAKDVGSWCSFDASLTQIVHVSLSSILRHIIHLTSLLIVLPYDLRLQNSWWDWCRNSVDSSQGVSTLSQLYQQGRNVRASWARPGRNCVWTRFDVSKVRRQNGCDSWISTKKGEEGKCWQLHHSIVWTILDLRQCHD
jgi:hypothetical protein